MYERDRPLLACPHDLSPLSLRGDPVRAQDGELLEAELVSAAGKIYPVTNGIPRFIENTGYNATWDFKWTEIDRGRGINYHQIGPECRELYEFDPYGEEGWRHIKGRLGLEIGCGVGQWSVKALRDHGADRMVSVDLTRGVDVFRKIVSERFPELKSRLLMVQASVFSMPFAPETFDYMFSLGVLHHTGGTLEAIRKACAVVKHGGEANIWVYCPRLTYLEDREPGHIYQVRRLSYPRRIVKVPQQLFVKFWMTVCRHLPVEKAYKLVRLFSAEPWWRFGNLPVVGFIPRMIFPAVDDPDQRFSADQHLRRLCQRSRRGVERARDFSCAQGMWHRRQGDQPVAHWFLGREMAGVLQLRRAPAGLNGMNTAAGYEFRPRAAADRDAWERLVEGSGETWLWHLADMVDGFAAWPGFEDLSFGVHDEQGRLAAIVPLYLTARRIRGIVTHRYMESIGGPACAAGTSASQRKKLLAAVREHLVRLLEEHDAECVDVKISALAPFLRGPQAPRVNPLVEAGFANTQTETWVVDLAPSPEAIRAAYLDGTKYELKRERREPYGVREAAGARDLEIFYALHCETCSRSGREPNPLDYFRRLFEQIVPVGRARIVFFERKGRVMAAQTTALYKGGAYYWHGPSVSDKSGGENRVLCDDQILHARAQGCALYETGDAAFDARDTKQLGLSNYKRSFGGKLVPHYSSRVSSPRLKFRVMRAARDLLRTDPP